LDETIGKFSVKLIDSAAKSEKDMAFRKCNESDRKLFYKSPND
jgi:hypothetical protein